jgi:hypothetical protein
MTQFVSLAQSSSDPNLVFGGTQFNVRRPQRLHSLVGLG